MANTMCGSYPDFIASLTAGVSGAFFTGGAASKSSHLGKRYFSKVWNSRLCKTCKSDPSASIERRSMRCAGANSSRILRSLRPSTSTTLEILLFSLMNFSRQLASNVDKAGSSKIVNVYFGSKPTATQRFEFLERSLLTFLIRSGFASTFTPDQPN